MSKFALRHIIPEENCTSRNSLDPTLREKNYLSLIVFWSQ